MKYNKFLEDLELIDQDHKNFSIETPLRDDAFEMSDDEKISIIQKNVIPETIIIALFTDEIFSKIKIKFSKLFKFNYVIGSVYISKKSSRIYINGFD